MERVHNKIGVIRDAILPHFRMSVDGVRSLEFKHLQGFLEGHGCVVTEKETKINEQHGWNVPERFYDVKFPEEAFRLRSTSKREEHLVLLPGKESDYIVKYVRGNTVQSTKFLPDIQEVEKE